MSLFILLPCLVAGLGFAALATWLTSRRGKAIQQLLATGDPDDALLVEIGDRLRIRTNAPIVALYLIAASVALGIPALTIVRGPSGCVQLRGTIKDADPGGRTVGRVDLDYVGSRVREDGFFQLLLDGRSAENLVSVEGENYSPVTLVITQQTADERIAVNFGDHPESEPQILSIKNNVAVMPSPILLQRKLPVSQPAAAIPASLPAELDVPFGPASQAEEGERSLPLGAGRD